MLDLGVEVDEGPVQLPCCRSADRRLPRAGEPDDDDVRFHYEDTEDEETNLNRGAAEFAEMTRRKDLRGTTEDGFCGFPIKSFLRVISANSAAPRFNLYFSAFSVSLYARSPSTLRHPRQVSVKVSPQLRQRVTAELLHRRLRKDEGQHRLRNHSHCRHCRHIASLSDRFCGLTGFHLYGSEGAHQGADRFHRNA